MKDLTMLKTLWNKEILTLFLPISQKQHPRHPTHSSWSCHSHIMYHRDIESNYSWNASNYCYYLFVLTLPHALYFFHDNMCMITIWWLLTCHPYNDMIFLNLHKRISQYVAYWMSDTCPHAYRIMTA